MVHLFSSIKRYIAQLSLFKKAGLSCIIILLIAYSCCLPKTLFRVPYSTIVTDRHGELLGARIAADGQWRFPLCDTIPVKFARCLLAFEDQYFYYHPGVNPLAILRATWQNISSGRIVSGGSTLTMQTIRLSRNRPRTVYEKILEIILATRLELRYSKNEILTLYASHAPFGGNVIGLDAAAWRYFSHPASELSWAEAATLAVLPNAPSSIYPGKGREALRRKRNRVLQHLLKRGDIDSVSYQLALDEPLPEAPRPLPSIAPHLVDHFSQENTGQRIVSTIDKDLQQQIEHLAERRSKDFQQSNIRNLAILVIDLRSNQVVAYCGNIDFGGKVSGNQVDVITSPRSTGSILKPMLYYAALEEGLILPHTLLPDVPININGFAPQNFDHRFEGAVPADEALARSLNIPAVNLLQRYGVPKFYNLLRESGISTLSRPASYYGLSLILGGAEAKLEELYGSVDPELDWGTRFQDYRISLYVSGKTKTLRDEAVARLRKLVGVHRIEDGQVDALGILISTLESRGATVSAAESCTGGLASELLTSRPGSSRYMLGSVTSYAPSVKRDVLGVKESTIERYGTVSAKCAIEMAEGVLRLTGSDYSLSVTGVAGPDTDEGKAVGTVHLAFAGRGRETSSVLLRFSSWGRDSIRRKAVVSAFLLLSAYIDGEDPAAIAGGWEYI